MKINGEFILREVAGETMLIPVGKTALSMNGMILLNPSGTVIWKGLEAGGTKAEIVERILDRFEVERDEAEADFDEFCERGVRAGLLAE